MSDAENTIYKLHTVKIDNPPQNGCYEITIGESNYKLLKSEYESSYSYRVKARIWPSFEDIGTLILFCEKQSGKPVTGEGASTNLNLKGYGIYSACPKSTLGSTTPQQKIIFGPPGTGKSYSVDAIAESLEIGECPDRRIQTVFHPEYTYGDFIAKLMPISNDGKVEYRVVAGHFIKALAVALNNPEHNVLLQIDEINRGNCAAIFGDIFQLLDRDRYGNSSYKVHLSELAMTALAQEMGDNAPKLQEIRTSGAYIPANLSIIATMNTSDESVYFMDSAFKRRWQFQYIGANNDVENDDGVPKTDLSSDVTNQRDAIVKGDITWDCLRRSINLFMIANAKTIRGIEDKQIGLWFVKATGTEISEADITFKLMHYLWDNVFARDKKPLRELLAKNETDLATFGQFVNLKDEFIQKVSAECLRKKNRM